MTTHAVWTYPAPLSMLLALLLVLLFPRHSARVGAAARLQRVQPGARHFVRSRHQHTPDTAGSVRSTCGWRRGASSRSTPPRKRLRASREVPAKVRYAPRVYCCAAPPAWGNTRVTRWCGTPIPLYQCAESLVEYGEASFSFGDEAA
ncbi:hypothetical protein TraAM80_09123 [Trypanosoma rangeli]|uniref:Secreted protein n=1 Tax=Trypanosoma rangeli TaxID=5698 RepID=A0A422MXB2_TRYRA|nr:uncharacterized protein TraAM80_09123 [Trypanosoma rangeli]RNE97830.1 hypothetical protein TraAM80_09123 [Trypanosoma rangeli]|eukprot:RNE97830.1 hypothetical protein TraAM80_09123 [Trypanosoma rangeli]